jgi:cellulose synthase/poly-beta-1,6-N-acetylglucosamine synthase-like glycosyltransferase
MPVADLILVIVSGVVSLPLAWLTVEILFALLPIRRRSNRTSEPRPRCAILIPAHNEEFGIARTLNHLTPELCDGDRVLVIADNCTDTTAQIARQAGVEAIERDDPVLRGKGYALDFGLKHLNGEPPDVVVVIDADTRVVPGSLDPLVRAAARHNTPVQGVFTDVAAMRAPRQQWSAFALTLKNHIRPLGLHRLGLPCLLTGSGMAFPWHVIWQANLGTGNIVEDMQLGIDLALAGYPARFCPEARFHSDDAPHEEATAKRRTRWEHGHVFTLLTQAPRLFMAGLIRLRPRLIALAMELAVPPLSLLLVVQLLFMIFFAVWWQAGRSELPVAIQTAAWLACTATIGVAWWRFGRALISPRTLLLLPVYVLWKLPIYLKLLRAPQRTWERTERKPA